MFTNMSQFIHKCESEGLSPKTIRWYKYGLARLEKFLDGVSLDEASEANIRDFLIELQRWYSGATVQGNYTTLRIYYKFLYDEELRSDNPMKRIKKPRTEKRVVCALSQEEVVEFLEFFKHDSSFIGVRNHAIMTTLLSTGLRKAELLNMQVGDISVSGEFFKVLGKGEKERVVPIGETLRAVLDKYFKARRDFLREQGLNSRYVWVNRSGEKLTESGIDNMFKQIKRSSKKWSTRISAHTLRHTFAVLYLANGGDVFSLQKLMGHSDISVTRIYAEMNQTQLTKVANRYNPLDNTAWMGR